MTAAGVAGRLADWAVVAHSAAARSVAAHPLGAAGTAAGSIAGMTAETDAGTD